jgi:hypothetical protein
MLIQHNINTLIPGTQMLCDHNKILGFQGSGSFSVSSLLG